MKQRRLRGKKFALRIAAELDQGPTSWRGQWLRIAPVLTRVGYYFILVLLGILSVTIGSVNGCISPSVLQNSDLVHLAQGRSPSAPLPNAVPLAT